MSATPLRGIAIAAADTVPNRDPAVRLTGAATNNALALYRSTLDGHGPPPHIHRHEDETIVILSGQVQATCGDDVLRGGPGATIFLPRGRMHTFRSVDGPAEFLFVVTPGNLDEFFAATERLDADGGDLAEVARLAQRFF